MGICLYLPGETHAFSINPFINPTPQILGQILNLRPSIPNCISNGLPVRCHTRCFGFELASVEVPGSLVGVSRLGNASFLLFYYYWLLWLLHVWWEVERLHDIM